MSSVVKIQKRRAFSAVPDDILEDTRMRTETRLVLGWLVGRPNGWEVRVGHVQRMLGLTRPRWVKARKEMELFGYLLQIRRQKVNGHFVWEHIVTDTPKVSKSTIVLKSNDGKTIDGKPHDIATESNQDKLNTSLNGSIAITQKCFEQARQRFSGYDIHSLESEWLGWHKNTNKPFPKNPDQAFLAWAQTYIKNHPLPYGGAF